MSLDEGISRLIQRIYCAREDSAEWDDVSQEILAIGGGVTGLATVLDLRAKQYSSTRFYGSYDSNFARGMQEYSEIYLDDPSLQWASRYPEARFCDSRAAIPQETYIEDEYVKWNLARFGATHWLVGYTQPEDELSFSLSVHFPAENGPGQPEALTLFRLLFDHLDCAIRLGRRPFNPDSQKALFLLDSAGRVKHLSAGAQRLARNRSAVLVDGMRITTVCPSEQATLDRALRSVLNIDGEGSRPKAVRLSDVTGRQCVAVIKPLLSSYGPFGKIRRELLVEVHEGVPRIGSIQLLQSLYDLTAREMQVLRLLADGHSIESLAACMAISPNTARTHMRAIFSKTGTTRQSELLQLCAGLATA